MKKKDKNNNPFTAFLLSFFLPGLGYIYNGMLVKGFVLGMLHLLFLLFIVFYKNLYSQYASLLPLFLFFLILISLVLIFSIQSAVYVKRHSVIVKKWYNRWYYYCIYSILYVTILISFYFLIVSRYSIIVANEKDNPYFKKNDILLVYNKPPTDKGTLILYWHEHKKTIGRYMASGKDTVEYKDYIVLINNMALPLKVAKNTEAKALFEQYNKKKYITHTNTEKPSKIIKPIVLKEKEVCVLSDNRAKDTFHHIIHKKNIIGEILGVLFTSRMSNIFQKPHRNN